MADGLKIHWHDQELRAFMDRWPKRTRWAMKEAMEMTGGHMRKKIRAFIESGGQGWPPLSPTTRARKGGGHRSPLYKLAQLVRFKATGGKNPRVRIGFFTATKRGKTAWNRRQRERFKGFFGGTPAALAKKHEFGKRVRVTPQMRRGLIKSAAAVNIAPIRKSTKYFTIPRRPMIGPVFRKERARLPEYLGDKFWQKMQSREGTFK